VKGVAHSFLVAVQFLTRLPVPRMKQFPPDALAKSVVFFPLVGLLVAAGGVLLNVALSPYVSRGVVVVVVLVYLVAMTGGLHEDALGDAADGFGGGWEKEQILGIMRDSRIGSFGAIAIMLGLLARFVFLTDLPIERFGDYFVAGQVLGRWSAIPMSFFLPSARAEAGVGNLIAQRITVVSLALGTLLAGSIVALALRSRAVWIGFTAVAIVAVSGSYYRSRIGGITGDCLGATVQMTEVAVYFAGVILR
jgi:adenosylcobinamide-GDP ribazoletransferase